MGTIICKTCGRELDETMFKLSRWGKRVSVCTECANAKRKMNAMRATEEKLDEMSAAVQNARHLRIHDFTPRELMEELARRGYTGKLEYTETKVIDISNFQNEKNLSKSLEDVIIFLSLHRETSGRT